MAWDATFVELAAAMMPVQLPVTALADRASRDGMEIWPDSASAWRVVDWRA